MKNRIKIIGLPYHSFKQKIRTTKRFERDYHIQDLSNNGKQGVLYMERRTFNDKVV